MALVNLFGDLALDSTSKQILALLKKPNGDWAYAAGVSGTVALSGGKRVTRITAYAPAGTAASVSVAGGPSIPVVAGGTLTLSPNGNLTDPSITFTGTASYVVEYVSDTVSYLKINAAGDRLKINAAGDLLKVS